MSNRRRSERYAVTLPVWLKDGRGGERTHTVDVSAHGIAVLATHGRPLRQYVELELRLKDPEASIAVTAVVARHAELLHPETGAGVQGLGLDFFLFDAQAKAAWQAFIHKLHAEGPVPQPAPVSAPPPEPPPADDEDDTPTFIIKPRDLGRLWAFFRGEMAKGMVRIETPILKPVGSPAELLVVHPTSLAEWALPGKVARATEAGRGGRPVLEIGLTPMSADSKAAFRNFVATGRGQVEEEVLISSEVSVDDPLAAPPVASDPAEDEPERIESVVIDLDNLDGDEAFGDRDALLEEGLIEAPRRYVTHPVTPQTPGASAEREGPEDDPTQHAPAPLPPPARAASGPARRREAEERPTSVFASFFAEAGMGEPSVEAGPTPATPAWAQQEPTGES
ncbi:MAG: PilZ domain-containing protein, partial [Myxococcales bacterium]|nr:PilZ domain-containing protein [Myxococcales bacterium]